MSDVKLKPEVVDIPFGTDRHKQVLEALRQRYQMSRQYMSNRYTQWTEQEERFRAYVNLTENDQKRKDLRKLGKPQYVTIDVPYSYAMLMTAHTYWTSVFLSRNPVLQYAGRHGQTQQQEKAVEALIDYQLSASRTLLPLYLWFMDAGKYGLGALGNAWFEDRKIISQIVEVPRQYFGIQMPGTQKKRQYIEIKGYEGNRAYNIRPQDFFPDPRVPVYRLQDGEFCGRMVEAGWNTITKRQAGGWYFNVDEMQKNIKGSMDYLRDRGSAQLQLPASMDTLYYSPQVEDPQQNPQKRKSFIELLEMVVEIVPRDWGLGASTYPEKWAFTVGNMSVILNAMPTGAYHGKFEFFPLEYEVEGYALTKRSMLEIVQPLNDVVSWLFNSHMYNVRKTLNDQMIVDPSRVVMKDFTDPTSGRIVRLKPEAYGQDPKGVYSQLQVVDVTQQNLRDIEVVTGLMQRVLGVNDNSMGAVNQGGRKTATEIRTSSTLGINRMKTNCEYMSAMGFTPWAEVWLQNTQQRYDTPQQFRIAGQLANGLQSIEVTPDMIAGEYAFVPVDGTMPIDRFAQANLWKELATAMRQMPEVAQQFDWAGIMSWIAQLSGANNFDQFRIKANVVPDESVANGVQAGNLVPISGGANGGNGTNPGGARNLTAIPGSASVGRVGRTG